ncbi:hypothetical protein SAMD00019534_078050 [Acytostelium subglobosum LB1]|uniref:hypothetical protein n=1 Tax=Acytostelium subglobosum LB1 TaxID=1410327 RepID=UPI0006447D1A|nr:hypothetical protein SAMD00019534_078050 [Acytostelium subglobosum LB1]GAM24630.1 hypothetical protein SAMD00019534_078050 [Acytostelium subglobosum LB1]|eukprot:XP_012752299.1 hypothetical protein SAMD00019534_078050 [Acytostelium subglobosum LB1]
MLFTRDAAVAKAVLATYSNEFEKPPDSSGVLIRLARNGILMAEGERWQRHREVISAAFSPSNVRRMYSTLHDATMATIDTLIQQKAGHIDCHQLMTELTYDIIGMLSIGHRFSSDHTGRGSSSSFTFILDEMTRPLRRFSRFIPLPSDRKLNRLVTELEDIIVEAINKKKAHVGKVTRNDHELDLLDHLLGMDIDMDQDEIISNVMTFLLAGHETSANALTFVLYLLSTHQDIQEQLYQQLNEFNSPLDCDLLEWVILETLRLYPPAPMVGRVTKHPVTLPTYSAKDITIPAQGMVLVSVYSMHRNESVWMHANRFDPFRWATQSNNINNNYNYLPFSSGKRVCIGQKFTMMEAKIIIGNIIGHYMLTWDPSCRFETYQRATLTPKNKVIINIEPRSKILYMI